MYDDKWTEVDNNQNDQNNQSGPQAAGNQTGMGQPARQQVYGLSGQGPVSYTHLDVYKRQVLYETVLELDEKGLDQMGAVAAAIK